MASIEEIRSFYEPQGITIQPTGENQNGSPTYNVTDAGGTEVYSLEQLNAEMAADSGTGLPSNIRVTQSPDGVTNQFWEVTPNGSFPLAQSQNPQLEALAKSLKAAGLEDATNVSPQDVSAYVGRFANEYGLSAPSQPAQPQGNFVQGKDLPTGVPPGMEDQWFMRDPRGGLSAWQPPEQSPLTLEQQIGQMVSQGNFEAARQLNEMKRAFNEKRMTQEEIADRASRLAQTPQEMQAWMSAMTGSTGPTPGDGTSWGSAYPPASMSQVIDQFKQIIATQPTPGTTPDTKDEDSSIAASVGAVPVDDQNIVDADTTDTMSTRMTAADMQSLRDEYEESLKPTPMTGGILSRPKETRDRFETRQRALRDAMIAGEDEILDVPIMPGGIRSRPEATALRFARKEEPSRTYIRREPGRRPTIGVRPDPILPGDISFAEASRMSEEERVLREQDAAMKRLAALGPMDIEEYGLGGGDEAELDIIRRREEILGRPFALYRTPGATGTVKLSRFESTPEERAFIERTGGINPANLTVSASNQVQYHGVGGVGSPRVVGEEEQMMLGEPDPSGMDWRGMGTFPQYQMEQKYGEPPTRRDAARLRELQLLDTDVSDEDVAVPTTIFGISRPTGLETFDRAPGTWRQYQAPDEDIMIDPLSPDRIRQLQRRYGSGYPTYTPAGQAARDVIPGLGDKIVDIDERKTNKKPIGSFHHGGEVHEDGAYNLQQGEIVVNPFEMFPSLNPYKPMDQASFQQMRQSAGQGVTQGFAPEQGEQGLLSAGSEAILESREAARIARGKQRELDRPAREERRRQRELERQRKQNELSGKDMGGVSGGGRFFAGSQIIPYADTAARLTALQKSGLSRRDAAMFDQAERERSMAGQQRFVRRGGKRRTYG